MAGDQVPAATVRQAYGQDVDTLIKLRSPGSEKANGPFQPGSLGYVANSGFPSFNLDKAFPGALSTGFLHPRYSVVDINPDSATKGMSLDQKAVALLEERWRLLSALRESERSRESSRTDAPRCLLNA